MGKIYTSWELVGQSFAMLRSDKALMLYPILAAWACVLSSVLVIAGGGLVAYPSIQAVLQTDPHGLNRSLIMAGVFLFYVVNYFVMVFFNTALVGAATIRLNGGTPTLSDGLDLAWKRKGVILQWALLAATVGMLLNMIENRGRLIASVVARVVGMVWTLASFFVVPVLAIENVGPMEALRRSQEIFRKTWGEEVVGGLSFGLIFFLLALPGILLPLMGARNWQRPGLVVGLALMILYFLFLGIASSATHGIFVAALYRYATTGEVAGGFQAKTFSNLWQGKAHHTVAGW